MVERKTFGPRSGNRDGAGGNRQLAVNRVLDGRNPGFYRYHNFNEWSIQMSSKPVTISAQIRALARYSKTALRGKDVHRTGIAVITCNRIPVAVQPRWVGNSTGPCRIGGGLRAVGFFPGSRVPAKVVLAELAALVEIG